MKRILTIAASGDSFVKPIAAHLARKYEVHEFKPRDDLGAKVHTSDLVWSDWCDAAAVEVTRHAICPVIIRCHSYELFSDFPTHIDWRKVRRLIFTTDYTRDMWLERFRKIPVPYSIIRKGFDAPDEPPTREWAPNICALGGLNYKKGMTRLLDAFRAIHRRDPQYRFHIAGELQDLRYAAAINAMRREGMPIQFHGHMPMDQLMEWMSDKAIFLSTSPWEVDPVAVRDAVAAGCFPLIRKWPGAETLYPSRWLWETDADLLDAVADIEQMIQFGEPGVMVATNIGELQLRCSRAKELSEIGAIVDGILDAPYTVRPWPKRYSREARKNRPVISLAMLVHNRAATLERALASVRDVADEAVLIDAGSTDGTLEIAKRWGCRVIHRDWDDDFSAARNFAAWCCRGKWIYVCDSDDFLFEAGNLRDVMLRADDNVDAVAIHGDQYGPTGLQEQVSEILAYRKGRGHYIYPIHNQLRGISNIAHSSAVGVSDYIENLEEKLKRTIPLLEAGLERDPDNGHWAYFLARSWWAQKHHEKAIHWCRYVTERFPDHTGYSTAWTWLVQATLESPGQEPADAVAAADAILRTALEHHPDLGDLRHIEAAFALWRWFQSSRSRAYAFATQSSRQYVQRVPEVTKMLGMPFSFREEK